jgi:hypothetical protein
MELKKIIHHKNSNSETFSILEPELFKLGGLIHHNSMKRVVPW